jgi:anti-sigma regulatory factor (Ser/Thr protein kinase)
VGSTLTTKLTLPNDSRALPVARAYLCEVIGLAGLPSDQADALVLAAEEACANVLDHAFEPGEEGTFTVAGEVTPTDVIVSVHDQGLPFDPRRTPSSTASSDRPARLSASGGLSLIRQAVDRAEWVNHGRQGKELRLVRRRPQRDVTEQLPPEQLSHLDEDAPLAPEQEYTVRCFQPEDALGVSRCIYRVYGNTYLHEDCYYPERLVQLNEAGNLVSIVALDAAGEVVGHYALERPNLGPVAERGMAVVSPSHRGRDLMGRMRSLLEEEARRLGLVGVYSDAVAVHPFSQRVNESFGSDVCGIALGGGTSRQVFKQITSSDGPGQRVSYVTYFTYVRRPSATAAYAPEHHQEVLRQIYGRLEIPVRIQSSSGEAVSGPGEMDVTYDHTLDSGKIHVLRVGEDTEAEIRRARRDLFAVTGAEAMLLYLPLAQPGTPELCRAAEAESFFFSGLGPSMLPDGDALILQSLNVSLDTSLLKLASPFAQELVRYIDRERERVAR